MSRDYLDVEYSATARPMTDYPSLLAVQLASKWDLRSGQTLLDVASGRAEMSAGFISGVIRPNQRMPLADASV